MCIRDRSNSGIGIIRISGGDAVAVADRIYRSPKKKCLKEAESHTVQYGYITEKDEILDEVLVIVMRGPSTYTGEDTVEIDCHGGMLVMERILRSVIRNGARPVSYTHLDVYKRQRQISKVLTGFTGNVEFRFLTGNRSFQVAVGFDYYIICLLYTSRCV